MSSSRELLERLVALKRDTDHVAEHIKALCEGVESLHAHLAEAEQDRQALREPRESLAQSRELDFIIMEMIEEPSDPTFPDNIRYFPGCHPDGVA